MSHWYDKDGEPRHFEGKNGGDTTLREARKLGLYPSVTTIAGILHKEGLVYWKQEQAALTAYEYLSEQWFDHWFDICETDAEKKQFTKKIIALAKEKVTEKSDAGTEIHDKLEKFHEDPFGMSHDDQKMCFAIADCIKANTRLSLFEDFIPEQRFCDTEHGYAGMCDLHTKPTVETPWVLDYKSKDEVNEKTKGYPDQAEQLAAYSHGLRMPEARLGNIFISRTPPPEDEPWGVKFFEQKNDHAWANFLHTLRLWQIKNKYGPYYESWCKQSGA